MKNITMIAAIGKNLELGRNNELIWRFKEDMKFFKNMTMGKPIIMGYNTFKSLPGLLPGRKHIVLTTKDINLGEEVEIVHSIDELLDKIIEYPEVMIIGGASIYSQMIEYSNKMYLTEIEAESEDADVFFPKFNQDDWNKELISEIKENEIKYKHLVYKRKLLIDNK